MRHQLGITLVAFACTQLAGEFAVELLERACAAQKLLQPRLFSCVGGGAKSRLALEDGQ